MDTNQDALSRAHQHLAGDLEKLAQLIDPLNDQALALVSQAHTRLRGIEELVKLTGNAKPNGENTPASGEPEKSETPHLSLSDLNPLLHTHPVDTMAHVRSVLMVLCELEFEDGAPGDPGDFNCGLHDLFFLLERTLKMHEAYGDELPDDVVLKQAEWQVDLQRRRHEQP